MPESVNDLYHWEYFVKKTVKKTVKKKAVRRRAPQVLVAEINRRIDFVSSVSPQKTEDCVAIRASVKKLALQIARTTPMNREQSLAITKLEEALYFAIASIVRPSGE